MKTSTSISILVLLAVAIFGARLYARKSAADFGGELAASFSYLGHGSFADTKDLREFLASPEMTKRADTARQLSILGGGYDTRIDEVGKGLIYLSEQMALPQDQRYGPAPKLTHFKIEPDSTSDRSVIDAAEKLILDYRQQVVGQ